MSTTLTTTFAVTEQPAVAVRPLWRPALVTGGAAAGATTAIAAVASAAGVSFETAPDEAIPLLGFAQLTVIGAAVGLLIAWLARRAAQPRALFVRTAVALTALSVVPDLTMTFDAASRAVLVVTHVVAA